MVCRGTYVAKGRIRFFFGPKGEQVIDADAGDYIYTPVGEFHSQLNLSDTETAEYTSTYVGRAIGISWGRWRYPGNRIASRGPHP